MKRTVRIIGTTFGAGVKHPEAEISITKDGMTVNVAESTGSFREEDRFIEELIRECINMDGWQHSWHNDISDAKNPRGAMRKKLRAIMLDKIERRREEIQKLKDTIQILGRWHY